MGIGSSSLILTLFLNVPPAPPLQQGMPRCALLPPAAPPPPYNLKVIPEEKYTKPVHPDVGEPLKASDLRVGDIVCVHKPGRPVITLNVVAVTDALITLSSSRIKATFPARRTGDDRITDDVGSMLYLYRYLGEIT